MRNHIKQIIFSIVTIFSLLIISLSATAAEKSVNSSAPSFPIGSKTWISNLTTSSVKLIWTPATDDIGIVKYQIMKMPYYQIIAEVSGTSLSYQLSGLSPGNKYEFVISAVDTDGYRADSPSITFRTPLINNRGIQLEPLTSVFNEDTGTVSVKVVRDSGFGQQSVQYSTVNGSAVNGSDYNGIMGQLTFMEGETTRIIQVYILDDNKKEDLLEVFSLRISSQNPSDLGDITTIPIVIRDND